MESIFKWMSDLGTAEGMKYFFILAAVLALIPYSQIISKFLKQIVLKKKFQIHFFEYSIDQNIYVGEDEKGRAIYLDLPEDDIFINGTKLKLYWKIDGAYRIDIHPVGKKLKGNCAEVLINANASKYVLTAYGFWNKKLFAEIELPTDKIYHLDTTKISTYSNHIIRHNPRINTLPITESLISTKSYSQKGLKKMNNWLRLNLMKATNASINTQKLVHANETRKKLYENLDDARLIKGYTFSTKKYQNLNQ
jgi:hypothetical protein